MKKYFLLLLATTAVARAATITVVNQDAAGEGLNDPTPAAAVGGNTGTTVGQQRLIVMQRAATLWGARIVSPVAIQLGAKFDPLSCSESSATLGSAGPHTIFRDFAGAPKSGTYYAVALANAWAGTDLDPANVDVDAQFNSNLGKPGCLSSVQWYYGLDGNAPGGAIDFLQVVLHELAHGLGFLSTVDLATGAKFNGFNDAFMLHLEDHSTGELYPAMTDAERVAASTDVGDLHWIGSNVVAASDFLATGRDSSGHVLMYASNPAQPGSSVSHFDTSVSPNELMEPFANSVMDRRLTEELFRDIGWTVLPPIQTNGQALISEACVNGAIDSSETVTVELTLTNIGFANVANLTATLLATNGVTNPGTPQNYGAMTVLGPSTARSFTFTASGQCGEMIRPSLHLQDGSTDYGIVSFSFRLGTTREYTNSASIAIPLSGTATPYPSAITISNYAGLINGLGVRLLGINHSNPDDLDILLVGPGGQKALIMSDSGGSADVSSVTLTLSDFAGESLPNASQITTGTYRPTDNGTSADSFSAPAPAGPYTNSLSVFNGTNPNGTWQLFVIDDNLPASGSLANGWALILPECCSTVPNQPPTLTFASPATNYVENAPPLGIAADAGVTDSDSPNFNGGSLTVAFATNGTTADQLGIRHEGSGPGQIGVSANSVTFGGLAIGNCSGGTNGSPLVVNLTSTNATLAAAQALCRAITFFNLSDTPSTDARHVRFTITDGMNGSATAAKSLTVIAVNDTPGIAAVTDRSITEDTSTGALPFVIGDPETAASALAVSATSSNLTLVPLANIAFNGSASNRTVTIQPATNQFGTTRITIFVTDGLATNSTSFVLTVTPVNDVPAISSVLNQSIPEDTSTAAIHFTIGDVETTASALVVSATSSNVALVPLANIAFNGSASNRTVTIQPATNQSGISLITLLVTDGQATNSSSFLLTVATVNDVPFISSVPDQAISEDTSAGPINFTVGDAETAPGALFVSATSSNLALAPLSNIVFGGSASNRTVLILPATNEFGTTLLTLRVSDGQSTNTASFLVTVAAINDGPIISTVPDQSIPEDTVSSPINFTVGDVETAASALAVFATSSNSALVPLTNLMLGGSASNRTLTIFPATNAFGTTLIALSVTDGQVTNSTSFLVTVAAVNDSPEISTVLDQTVPEDTSTGPFSFTVSDVETPDGALVVSATSSNQTLVPLANIGLDGLGSNRSATILPNTNQTGVTLITLFVTDGDVTNSRSFLLTVTGVNDGPVISSVADQTILEDTSAEPLEFTIADVDTAPAELTVSATSSNTLLIPLANIVFGGSASNRFATISPATNEFGTSLVTFSVSDGQATNSSMFLVTVLPQNDAPTISTVTPQFIQEDASTEAISFTVGDVETPASALTVSATSSNLTLVPVANVLFSGSASNRNATILPATNEFGTTLITLFVTDGEATNSTSFLLTVASANDGPLISPLPDQTILEDDSTGPMQFTVTDADTLPNSLTVTATSSNVVLVSVTNIVLGGSESVRTVTIQPATNEVGTTLITLFVTDGSTTNSTTFSLTVTGVNDAPVISAVSDHTIAEDALAGPIALVIGDAETDSSLLVVSALSSNTSLVPATNIVFTGSDSSRTVMIRPETNHFGTTLITLLVTDGEMTNSSSFLLTVTPENDTPDISAVPSQSIPEDTATGAFDFIIGDLETPSSLLLVSATSSNPTMVPLANISFSGSDSNRNIVIAPSANEVGTTLITLVVSDGQNSNSTSFLFTVTPLNDAPVISSVLDKTILEDTATAPIHFTVGDTETTAGGLTISATSSNTTLVPLTNIVLSGSDSNRTVTIQPATNEFGTTLITLLIDDGQTTNATSFLLTVTPVNDAPTLGPLTNITVIPTSGTFSVDFTGVTAGPTNEQQTLSVAAFLSSPLLFDEPLIVYQSADSSGSLLLTPLINVAGTSTVAVVVTDTGGAENGGVDATTNTFELIVVPLADIAVTSTATFQGTNLVITATLTNLGPHTAHNVIFTNILPIGAKIVSLSDAASCVTSNGSIICSFPSLLANTTAVVTLTLAVEPQSFFTNVSLVTASEIDPDPTNNSATVIVQMGGDQDFDADGIPDWWELANGSDARTMDATDDADEDLFTNLNEYLAGTNPHDAGSFLRITAISLENNSVVLSFLAVSNRSYSIQSSTNLSAGSWENMAEVFATRTGVSTVTNIVDAAPARFYRAVTPP